MLKTNKAFTLVEVMIVVAIIILLAAIAIPNLLRAKVAANDATARATLKSVANALENYMAVNNVYPSATGDLLTAVPPYLNNDYFTGTHHGFNYTATLTDYTYSILAAPVSINQTGTTSFTITTGAVLQ